ncbi:hypothetical protein AAVH_37114 [Aphelenchoides avenae]|nr:hypothetical protein AAVH_37114 [Aphelenchus avenae]
MGPTGAKCMPEGYCGYPKLITCEADDECDGGICINSVCVNPSTGPCLAEGLCPFGETCIEDECYEPGLGPIGGPLAPLSPANSSSTLTGGDLEADAFPDYSTPDVAVHGKVNEEL